MNQVQNQWQVSIMIHEIHHVPSNHQATKDEKCNRINLFNDLKRTNIVGGKLPREVCRKLQMISGQPSI